MKIVTTNAAEIAEFIAAEQIIAGTGIAFTSREKATGRQVEITANYLIERIREAEGLCLGVRETESTDGRMMVQIHQGESVYGTYIRN